MAMGSANQAGWRYGSVVGAHLCRSYERGVQRGVFPRWQARPHWLIRWDRATVGEQQWQSSHLLAGSYLLSEQCGLFPRWQAHPHWLLRSDRTTAGEQQWQISYLLAGSCQFG